MKNRMTISDEYTNGAQPTEQELRQLAEEGFGSVVNLRTDGEEEQPLSPDEEGRLVRELGMEYLHIPVSTRDMREEQVDQFRQKFPNLPRPVFGHCRTGKRSGAFVMMHTAVENGWTGEETLGKAREMGFECDKPELEKFVKSYIDAHTSGPAE